MNEPSWAVSLVRELQSPRPAFALLLTCGALLFLSGPVAQWVAPGEDGVAILARVRLWLLGGALFAASLMIWDLGRVLVRAVAAAMRRHREIGELKDLTDGERKQVAWWVSKGIKSGVLDGQGVGASLADRGVFERVDEPPDRFGQRRYRIPRHVWKYLMEHKSDFED